MNLYPHTFRFQLSTFWLNIYVVMKHILYILRLKSVCECINPLEGCNVSQ